jgi:cell division protein FtsN
MALQPQGETEEAKQAPEPRFDFYTLLPEQTIDVEVEPEPIAQPRASQQPSVRYLLQAGSFRQREDADRRRAELLLLGLEPKVEETSGDNGRWFRVYLGPFDAHSKMTRARSLTAGQDIDTLLLKRSAP